MHGSAVAFDGRGLLILGPSGIGKSALALGLVAHGASLIADDATWVQAAAPPLLSCPDTISGRIEARGLGLLRLPPAPPTPLWAVAYLCKSPAKRLPEPKFLYVTGHDVPLLTCAVTPSLAATLFVCLRHATLPTDTLDD